MADGSPIEWLALPGYKGATWNPTRGCSRQGAGCDNCWAIGQARRQDVPGGAYEGLTTVRRGRLDWLGVSRPVPEMLDRPLHWRDPRCVFVESMGDLWHPGIPFEFVAAVFGVMAACPQHRFIILTKQARRAREFFAWVESRAAVEGMRGDPSSPWWRVIVCASEAPFKGVSSIRQTLAGASWPLSNVALLVSAWDQKSAERYVPELNACPAAVRGVSAEPLLGPMDLMPWLRCGGSAPALDASGYIMSPGADSTSLLDWVIAGGESGPKARPMQPKWARSLRDQCASSGVPFFFKQWGNWAPDASGTLVNHRTKAGGGRELDGRTWEEFPEAWT